MRKSTYLGKFIMTLLCTPNCKTGSCEVPCGDPTCASTAPKRRSFHVAEKIIPAHTVYHCRECEHFNLYGAPYNDGNTCELDPNGDVRTVSGENIPDWCPIVGDHNSAGLTCGPRR